MSNAFGQANSLTGNFGNLSTNMSVGQSAGQNENKDLSAGQFGQFGGQGLNTNQNVAGWMNVGPGTGTTGVAGNISQEDFRIIAYLATYQDVLRRTPSIKDMSAYIVAELDKRKNELKPIEGKEDKMGLSLQNYKIEKDNSVKNTTKPRIDVTADTATLSAVLALDNGDMTNYRKFKTEAKAFKPVDNLSKVAYFICEILNPAFDCAENAGKQLSENRFLLPVKALLKYQALNSKMAVNIYAGGVKLGYSTLRQSGKDASKAKPILKYFSPEHRDMGKSIRKLETNGIEIPKTHIKINNKGAKAPANAEIVNANSYITLTHTDPTKLPIEDKAKIDKAETPAAKKARIQAQYVKDLSALEALGVSREIFQSSIIDKPSTSNIDSAETRKQKFQEAAAALQNKLK